MYHLREIISFILLFFPLNSEVICRSKNRASLPNGAWSNKIHVSVS